MLNTDSKYHYVEIGQRFGELEVVNFVESGYSSSGHIRPRVLVKCDCGAKQIMQITSLTREGKTCCKYCSGDAERPWQYTRANGK